MNIGLAILRALSMVAGVLFIFGAVRAIMTGNFKSPEKIIHGTPSGISTINQIDRPIAFWLCTIAYLSFGVILIVCAWFVL
jgi:phage shock protein PspC (stress-responsive transcriptional regulator)